MYSGIWEKNNRRDKINYGKRIVSPSERTKSLEVPVLVGGKIIIFLHFSNQKANTY